MFTQPYIQAQTIENIKTTRHWPLWGEFTETGEFPAQRPVTRKMFPFDDVIKTHRCSGRLWTPEFQHNIDQRGFVGLDVWTLPVPHQVIQQMLRSDLSVL